ncbi:MAG: hypothetical protein IJJ15_04315 [Ruminococcus sp.]|nr:hypothetical protein [Ruminococcus sp.]
MLKADNRTDNFIAFMLAALVYVPATSTGNLIRLGVVFVAFVMKHINEPPEQGMKKIAICMVMSPIVSVFFVFVIEGFGLNWAVVMHEIQRMVFCALLLMTVVKMQISFRVVYFITVIVLIPNFVIQLLQQAQVESVFTFIRNNYESGTSAEEWTHLDLAREEGSGFRAGSIFINPNVFMAIPLMSLVVFLHQDRKKSSIWNYGLLGCAVYSCFLTGSRTATIVMAIIIIWYIVKYAKPLSRVLLIIAVIIVAYSFGTYLFSSRAVQIFDTASFETKINAYKWYLSSTTSVPIYWISGSLGSRIANPGMDGEIGDIYAWFGVFGWYWYFQYYKFAFKKSQILFYSKPLTAVHIFVAFTASILLCMPIYSFAAVIFFSNINDYDEVMTGD